MASRTRTSFALRRALAAASAVAAATSLGGCLFTYDAPAPTVHYMNYYAEEVFVFIEGTSPDVGTPVEPQKANSRSVQDCVGEGLRVETGAGVEIGRVTDQACPGWRLTIHADGSLTYEERAD